MYVLLVFGTYKLEILLAEEIMSEKNALTSAFPDPLIVKGKWKLVSSNSAEKITAAIGKEAAKVFKHYEASSNNVVVGYAVIDSVPGKHGAIKLMTTLDPELAVTDVVILALREQRGRPIKKPNFLRQFTGKTLSSPLRIQDDIQGITGATTSSRAVTKAVKSAVTYLTILLKDNSNE